MAGSLDEVAEDLALKNLSEPISDLMAPRAYMQMQTLLDASWEPGFQNYWKAEYLAHLPDDAIEVLVDNLATITSPLTSADDQDRTPDSYREDKYRRLSELERRYDPENLLHLNQNILPASS